MSETTPDSQGIIYIATGEKYIAAAQSSAMNAKRQIPNLPIAIVTDDTSLVDRKLFDHVIEIDDGHYRSKVDHLTDTPFQRTLYVDTDIRFFEDITEIFQLLDRFDLAIAHAHARNRPQTLEIWRQTLPNSFPQFNGGVILYKSSPKISKFFGDWSKAFHEAKKKKDQVTLRELLWISDLDFFVLPPEYNIRYSRQASFWLKHEAKPKIAHFARFHDEMNGFGNGCRRRTEETLEDLWATSKVFFATLKKIFVSSGKLDK